MRGRFAVLWGVLLFSVMLPATAHASGWSMFVAWLSDLDPKSGGIGFETRIYCPGASPKFACEPDYKGPAIKASAAMLLGTLNENGGTIFVLPLLGSFEGNLNDDFSAGGGAGVIHVGGTLVGAVTRPLFQAQVTWKIPHAGLRVRGELNVIPKEFRAGTFAVGAPATGAEVVPGISVVLPFK